MKPGYLLVGLTILLAMVSLVWTPYDPNLISPDRLASPSFEHLMGTDRFGRCLLYTSPSPRDRG